MKKLLMVNLLLITVNGCSWIGLGNNEQPEPTLADLQPARMPDTNVPLPSLDLDGLTDSYRQVLESSQDIEVRDQVLGRLAGLEMLRGEQKLYQQLGDESEQVSLSKNKASATRAAKPTAVFDYAIESYRELLAARPSRPGNDSLLYQLSKAYDLNGQSAESLNVLNQLVQQYPHTQHYAEAQFRRAEIYFVAADYARAERAYQAVIEQGKTARYYQNALYMHGWAQFKRDRYRASLTSFSGALDSLVPADNQLDKLERGQRELVQDSLRVMSLVFSYLDGANTISEIYRAQGLGQRHYEPLLYGNLGQLYLSQERYRDSADVYRSFIDRYPTHDLAPTYSGKRISAFEQGDFPTEVLKEKEDYVARYGIRSRFWADKTAAVHDQIRPFLRQYITELAQHYHADAQQLLTIAGKQKKPAKALAHRNQAKQQFSQAANYYQVFIDTFPNDKKVADMTFLMAEAYFESDQFEPAITAFETVAYHLPEDKNHEHKQAAEAGYSAVLAYDALIKQAETKSKAEAKVESKGVSSNKDWLRLKIDSELRFAQQFNQDQRAPVVLARATEELFELNEYAQAISAAQKLIDWQPQLGSELRRTAWLVTAHAQFEQQQYPQAEQAYQQTLKLISNKQPSNRKGLVERLAASVYRQGEQVLESGDTLAAAEQFLRVATVAPGASIVVNAQYDAAANLLAAKAWGRAITVLQDFRNRYPKHQLSQDIPAQLVMAYQQNQQWQQAAEELTGLHAVETDPDKKRQALFLAAELFEKAGDKVMAIDRYRSYAHTHHQPLAPAMEARYRLSELYRQGKQPGKRRFWLRKMIVAHQQAGSQATDRSRYLAAFSSVVFADDAYGQYLDIKLTLPLKTSLKKKQRALDKALAAYRKTSDYGVEQFATQATFKIGAIYGHLSQALMASERPKLDALALEQYASLLEEQAFPFEEQAIAIHEGNAQRSWQGIYDEWVQRSFAELGQLLPARYMKQEQKLEYSDVIF